MYSSIKRICSVVLTGAIAMPAGTTLAPAIAHAQAADDPPAEFTPLPDRLPTGVPTFGIPYQSERANGEFFMGAIELERAELKDGQISATGTVRLIGRPPIPTVFPVEIIEASCEHFILKIGPPPVLGLLDPLHLEQSAEGGSDFTRSDFCDIAVAFADGDLEEVVSELNEVDEDASGLLASAPGALLGSCPALEWLGCIGALGVCTALCFVAGPACIECYAGMAELAIQENAICGRCLRP